MIQEKIGRLQQILKKAQKICIAFSGGVDSSFLAFFSAQVLEKENVMLVLGKSPSLPPEEESAALAFAHQYQLPLRVIDLHEIEDPNYKQNSPNRCYFCKLHLFSQIVPLANSLGFFYVADGANVEDLGDFRPGLQAAKKYHIHHPLIEAGLSKSDIRLIAKNMNLPIWNKPSMACLASRFPYGEEISLEKLLRVAKAESYLRSLGFNEFRVRSHGNLARLEMGEKDQEKAFLLRNSIAQELKNIGFLWVCLDCLPFQSGSMNLMLSHLNHHELSKPSKS